ncbi:hypothetical protein MHYP_G00090570 [Metynnis hypsauchen]
MEFFCVMLLIFTGFMETTSENFKVVGAAATLVVEAGEDLVLPCSLQPNISAEDMMVEWIRTDLTESNALVHLYKNHKDTNGKQIKSYRGRTALFKEELQEGNTSLKLSAVRPSDKGSYQCAIKSEAWYDDVIVQVEVKVHLKVVGPTDPLVVEAGADLVLPCSIEPSISAEDMMVKWIRLHLHSSSTNTLVHLYKGYKVINEKQMESYRRRTALFKEELKKGNTSLKLSAVQPSDEGVYQCSIEYRSWYDDVTVYVEVKDKYTEKELSPKQCSVVAYMRIQSENVKETLDLKNFKTSEEGYRRLIPAITKCRKAQFRTVQGNQLSQSGKVKRELQERSRLVRLRREIHKSRGQQKSPSVRRKKMIHMTVYKSEKEMNYYTRPTPDDLKLFLRYHPLKKSRLPTGKESALVQRRHQ